MPEWVETFTWMGAFGHFSCKPTKLFGDVRGPPVASEIGPVHVWWPNL